jgi:hypothetical protein
LVTDTLTVLDPADKRLGLIDKETDKSTADELTDVTAAATLFATFVSVVVVAMLAVALTLPVVGTTYVNIKLALLVGGRETTAKVAVVLPVEIVPPTTAVKVPPDRTIVRVALSAAVLPRLKNVTVPVTVEFAIAEAGILRLTLTSAKLPTVVKAVATLLAVFNSGVVVVTVAVKLTAPADGST